MPLFYSREETAYNMVIIVGAMPFYGGMIQFCAKVKKKFGLVE